MSMATTIGRNMLASARLLGIFALAGSILLAGTYGLTRDRIEQQQRASLQSTLLEVLRDVRYDNALLDDTVQIRDPLLGTDAALTAYRARRAGQPVAVLFPVIAPNGYSGAIRLLVGVAADGSLTGVRVLEHRETPGLGDKIETRRSDWIRQFAGLSIGQPPKRQWAVTKDGGNFDSFTGATITPRAVVAAVKNALLYFESNKAALYAAAEPATPPAN